MGLVYILCALAGAACTVLLLRGYLRRRTPLLLWCGLFFAAIALENVLLYTDYVLLPDWNVTPLRRACPLVGIGLLLYGLIWEVR